MCKLNDRRREKEGGKNINGKKISLYKICEYYNMHIYIIEGMYM